MSNQYNDAIEERVWELGYDKGFEDCRSELEMKIKAIMAFHLYKGGDDIAKMAGEIEMVLGVSHGE